MAAKVLAVTDSEGNPILPPEAETGLPELGGLSPSQMRPRVAKEKQPACALSEGCIKRGGHEKSRHAGEAKCSTYEQAYPEEGSGVAEAIAATSPPKARKKPVRAPLPTDPALWRLKHVTRSVDAIERIWNRIPPTKRALAREDVAAIIGQRDLEETAVKS